MHQSYSDILTQDAADLQVAAVEKLCEITEQLAALLDGAGRPPAIPSLAKLDAWWADSSQPLDLDEPAANAPVDTTPGDAAIPF